MGLISRLFLQQLTWYSKTLAAMGTCHLSSAISANAQAPFDHLFNVILTQ